jgi:IS5 family transposase
MQASGILSFVKASKKRRSSRSGKRRTKAAYRIRNWSEYNMALVGRGSLTLWFAPEVVSAWFCPSTTGKPGASPIYSDLAIITILTLGVVFHLPLRQQQGFAQSLMGLMHLDLPVPDYSTLCRRRQTLSVDVPASATLRRAEGVHLVVDSTGLKIYGEGEWKVRRHGKGKRRTWRKLHLGVDEATHEILSAELTLATVGDGEMLPALLEQTERGGVRIEQVSGDGSYDSWECHEAIARHGATAAIPVRRGSKIRQHGRLQAAPLPRDNAVWRSHAILRRQRAVGRAAWKQESGYHRRSLAETAMLRQKAIFGDDLRARLVVSQRQEAFVRCAALNAMTLLGMPDSYPVDQLMFA